jgi:hypothetical protein
MFYVMPPKRFVDYEDKIAALLDEIRLGLKVDKVECVITTDTGLTNETLVHSGPSHEVVID